MRNDEKLYHRAFRNTTVFQLMKTKLMKMKWTKFTVCSLTFPGKIAILYKLRKCSRKHIAGDSMKEKFYRFMAGRYGNDQFSRFLSYVSLALIVLNLFFKSSILWLLAVAALAYCYFRMFSRNMEKRRAENRRYLQIKYKFTNGFRNWRDRQKQRKDYCFFRCPGCKAMLRVPRGKGKIRVTCRKCGNAFERRT